MRLVLDPNVLISAVVADGVSRRLFDAWRVERRDVLMALLRSDATTVADPEVIEPVTADPGDDYPVALARREAADGLVSGDSDLTGLQQAALPVLTPAHALKQLDEPG